LKDRRELTLCLRDTEKGPDTHADEDGAEEEVGAVAQVRDHVRSGSRDDKGPEPGVGRGQRHAKHPDVQRENLRGDRPGNPLPRCAYDESVHVYCDHCDVAGGTARGIAGSSCGDWVVLHHVAADVEHARVGVSGCRIDCGILVWSG
jgi:hypothetical protein